MIDELTFALSDEPGALHVVLNALAEGQVNLRATLALGGTVADFGMVVLVCDPVDAAIRVLHKIHVRHQRKLVFAVALEDSPGQLAALCGALAREGINVRHLYHTKYRSAAGVPLTIVSLDDNERGMQILSESGIEVHRALPLGSTAESY